ncbi:MAG: pirin family protein [Microlunatus sp.]|nr:pirin family protein [Microlunatus sp.]MDN5770436.1 pirin family protein [Microlunatus sp.]
MFGHDPVLLVQRSGERFATRRPGITSRHAFSFGAHYDPTNVGFGVLLAHNEEHLLNGRGFDDHPHRDTEIITWVLSGSLLHQDSTGHAGIVHPGLAQRLSAGRGVVHAERNDAYRLEPDRPRVPVRFVQSWVRPDTPGSEPCYAQREVSRSDLAGDWVPVASGAEPEAAISLDSATSTLWVSVLSAGECRLLPEAAYGHVFVAAGEVEIEGVGSLAGGDSLRVIGPAALQVTGVRTAELLVWSMGG